MIALRNLSHIYRIIASTGLVAFAVTAYSQEVAVRGGFLADSLKIGEEIPFYLSATYADDLTVLFPDSTAEFAPFEYQRKVYYPTQTTQGLSVDSAVYYLTTFEIDRVQTLQLSAYLIQAGDSTAFASPRDTVLITQMVAKVPDTVGIQQLPLREHTEYEEVSYAFNTWMMAIIAGCLIALLVILWLLFGKKVMRWVAIRRLRKKHAGFLLAYNELLGKLGQSFSIPLTESALAMWKRYMEHLESRPYTKLTTRETRKMVGDPALSEHLSQIDRAIYGHPDGVTESLERLRQYANRTFEHKIKEVQHG